MVSFIIRRVTASYTAGNLRASVQNIGRTIPSIATEGVNVDRQEQLAEIDAILSEMDTNLTILKEQQMPDNELVNQLRESLKNQEQYREPVIEALKEEDDEKALLLYGKDYEPNAEKTRECLEAITAYFLKRMRKYTLKEGMKSGQRMTAVIPGAVVSSFNHNGCFLLFFYYKKGLRSRFVKFGKRQGIWRKGI